MGSNMANNIQRSLNVKSAHRYATPARVEKGFIRDMIPYFFALKTIEHQSFVYQIRGCRLQTQQQRFR